MPSPSQIHLATAPDSFLVVIDVQGVFLQKIDRAIADKLTAHIAWLIRIAHALDVPVIVTAEDMAQNGGVDGRITAALPPGSPVYDKDAFAVLDNPAISQAIAATGRKNAVCAGLETDVCVAQSALGLLAQGYRVMALQDAVAAPSADHSVGLGRMRDAGAAISSVKALYYEWVSSVSDVVALKARTLQIQQNRPVSLLL